MTEDEGWKEKIITPRVGVAGVVIKDEVDLGDGLVSPKSILMIRRLYQPFGIAFPGGFQEVGETVAQTAVRETKEETDIDAIALGLMRVNTMPHTDPRFHVTALYIYMEPQSTRVTAGDDAKAAFWMSLTNRQFEHEMSNTTVSVLNELREGRLNTIQLG
jgi:8-oxo-dGTP diphosphatase